MAAISCSCLKIEPIHNDEREEEIRLTSVVCTKGYDPITTDNMDEFGVFASFEEDSDFNSSTPMANYIFNELYYKKEDGSWSWRTQQYWPMKGKLSFFAYTPYIEGLEMENIDGRPAIPFTPLKDVTRQQDFCVSEPALNCKKTLEPIPLSFRHALSHVRFCVNYKGVLPQPEYYVKIDKITIEGVIGAKNMIFSNSEPYVLWEYDEDSKRNDSYTLTRKPVNEVADIEIPIRNESNDNHVEINPLEGRLFLVPQTINPSAAKINITYGFYITAQTSEKLMSLFEVEHPLPESEWKANTITNYTMTLDVGKCSLLDLKYSFDSWIEPWKNASQTDPIPIE